MTFLYNAWYPAAWSYEVGDAMLARTFLDIPVVLLRDESGAIVALHDMCPHRFAPLSLGTMIDGRLRCGYHGLEFDMKGNCVGNCLKGPVPKAAKVRVFPVAEQDRIIWIWMGDKPPTDPSELQRFTWHDGDAEVVYGYTHASSDYQLLTDNLMDLTHIHLLHPGFGGVEYPCTATYDDEGSAVMAKHIADYPEVPVNEVNNIRWTAPATHYLESISKPKEGGEEVIPSAHLLTPETATSTHYLWSSGTAFGMSVEETRAFLSQVFDAEDKPMVEAVQKRMAGRDFWAMKPLLLKTDGGGVMARRKLARMIETETA